MVKPFSPAQGKHRCNHRHHDGTAVDQAGNGQDPTIEVLNLTVRGERPRGIPWLQLMDPMRKVTRTNGIKNDVQDRCKWRRAI